MKRVLAGALACLVVLGVAVALAPRLRFPGAGAASTPAWLAVAWLAFGAGAWLVFRLAERVAVPLVVVGGLAVTLLAGFTPPHSSDDVYRYMWDGRVQVAGIDPYRYPPAAPELHALRDDVLWPADGAWCVPAGEGLAAGCTRVNRPGEPTIYPPVAEATFAAVYRLSPPGVLPWQLLCAALALATTVLLVRGLRFAGADPRRAVLWAWCPTVAVEAGNNAHVDVAAALLAGAGLLILARSATAPVGATKRRLAGGVLIGLAVATKLTPALVLPAVLRRRPVAVLAAAAGAVAVVYVPHLVAVGARVVGYLPGYLREEGYAGGTRFGLLTWFLPVGVAPVAAVLILAAVAIAVLARTPAERPWAGAAAMTGTALLVTTPSYPWYAVMLVLLVAGGAPAAWLGVAAAGYLAQYADKLGLAAVAGQRIGYGVAAVVVAAVAVRGHPWVTRRRADTPERYEGARKRGLAKPRTARDT